MYQALYRKWRPRVFEDVSGQPQVTQTLKNELIAGHVGHAYLFTGSRGTGKTTCAKILAKAVNCLHPQDGNPCNECEICKGIDSGSVLDVTEIDAASNNGVDSIRALREETVFTPASAKYRVYIVDEVHMLSTGAFNALLKTLEEPPAYVIFILATTEVHKIPATILSRCQRLDFRRIPAEDIAQRLLYVSGRENIALSDGGAALIARLSDGALRDGLSLLERCAGSGGEITEETVSTVAGLAGRDYLFAISDAVLNEDYSAALRTVDRLYREAKDQERLCVELIEHFRSILLLRTSADAEKLLTCSPAALAQLKDAAGRFPPETLLHALDALQGTLDVMRRSTAPRVEMEMCLLRLCNPSLDSSNASLLRRVASLERQIKAGGVIPQQPPQEKPRHETRQPGAEPAGLPDDPGEQTPETEEPPQAAETSQPASATESAGDAPLACWPEVLDCLASLDAPLRGFLNGSTAVLRGGLVLVDQQSAMFAELIRQPGHQKPLVEAVRRVTGKPYKVGIMKKALAAKPEEDPMNELFRNASDSGIGIEEK